MYNILKTLIIISSLKLVKITSSWPDHDISTLKLLQIVHRHGDRAITKTYPNDPFNDMETYWPEGLGELSNPGKLRMYKIGQFIRREYQQYLGNNYSPREVYARSNAKTRVQESVASLLAGAYPPLNKQWQWGNDNNNELGQLWQPIPIETFLPVDDDRLLRTEAYCPKATEAMNNILNSEDILNVLDQNNDFLLELGEKIGSNISTLFEAKSVYDHIWTEYERGYKWSNHSIWSVEFEQLIFDTLEPLTRLLWITEWNSTVVQKTRAGILVQELLNNFNASIAVNGRQKACKVYVYSTQDAMVAVLMHALGVFNNEIIPLGATLLFELHQKLNSSEHFVRLYYYNETLVDKNPTSLQFDNCDHLSDCPIDKYFELSKLVIPDNWYDECGIFKETKKSNPYKWVNLSMAIVNSVVLVSLIILVVINLCLYRKKYSYQSVD